MTMLGVEIGDKVYLENFRASIAKNSELLDLFELLTDGVRDLIAYSGENKYTKVVRVLNAITTKFNTLLDDVERGERLLKNTHMKDDRNAHLTPTNRMKRRTKSSILENFRNKFAAIRGFKEGVQNSAMDQKKNLRKTMTNMTSKAKSIPSNKGSPGSQFSKFRVLM